MIQKILIIILLQLSLPLFGQDNSIPTASDFDKILKLSSVTNTFNEIDTDKYYIYFIRTSSDNEEPPKVQTYNLNYQNVKDLYIFSSDGSNTYGSFDLSDDDTGLYARLLFRYNINKKQITDLVIPLYRSEAFATAYLVLGDMNNVKDYKRPNIPFMKMLFGGSPIEMLFLLIAFITSLLVSKNTLTRKSEFFGSILSQFQVILACIGAYGICGAISLFGSMAYNTSLMRLLPVYINSLVETLICLFSLTLGLFILMLLKLRPIKQVKFWMYSNLLIIPLASLGLILLFQQAFLSR